MYLYKVAEYNQLISQIYIAPGILSQTLQSFVYLQSYLYPRFINIDTWGIGNIVNKQRVVSDRIAGTSCVVLL